MSVIFKNFLPSVMRNTRWGELITVFQDIINDLRTEKVNLLKTKFIVDNMTEDEMKEMAIKFGYTLLSLDGYTSTTTYLKKQIKTIVERILAKNTRNGYKYIYYIYGFSGDIYPIRLVSNIFDVWDEYWTRESIVTARDRTLDEDDSYTLDSSDPDWITALDQTTSSWILLRHLVLQYAPKFIENANEFISDATHRSFYNDVKQMKRATELPYFEHKIDINAYSTGGIYVKTYYNYDQSVFANMTSIFLADSNPSGLINFDHIQLGNSTRTSFASGTISGVVSLVRTLRTQPSGEIEFINTLTSIQCNARRILSDKQKMDYPITELSLHNANSGCILYSTFPAIKWNSRQYSNLAWDIQLI
jgi:hypothetical protein